jgi:hypothetical protein
MKERPMFQYVFPLNATENQNYSVALSLRAAKCFERAFFIYRDTRKVGN